jgi:DNA-binding NarL/FixJ family response regulator
MNNPIKVIVFEDNKQRRELLEMLLNSHDEFTCVGAFENCSHVVKNIADCQPDVVLMDIDMPKVNGIEGLTLIRSHYGGLKVLMQTIFEEEDKIFDAILAGADGYILKKATPEKLLEAILEVMEGGAPMTPTVAKQVLLLFNNKHQRLSKKDFQLTPKEVEILDLLVQGYSYKMIAGKCHISYPTVNTHVSHIYEKLQVKSGTEAVAKAIQHKIV